MFWLERMLRSWIYAWVDTQKNTRNKTIINTKAIAETASAEKSTTILWTNKGDTYRSYHSSGKPGEKHDVHAEMSFLNQVETLEGITDMFIKNSPCSKCSRELIARFASYHKKPRIYVGRIYNLEDEEDRRGLKELLKEGFELKVWEELNLMLQNKEWPQDEVDEEKRNNIRSKNTHRYLKELKSEVYYQPAPKISKIKIFLIYLVVIMILL